MKSKLILLFVIVMTISVSNNYVLGEVIHLETSDRCTVPPKKENPKTVPPNKNIEKVIVISTLFGDIIIGEQD